ncbi:DNA primase large subunit-like isoform X2 [Branchiostoma floridae]|uniref:DNA primase large subunit-like isoform X2 n=1 Tax=Branchiostoma floridae TaxID=7739 RepID=A0A9J7HND1_BRAFL|nr:DNA primase large subunit-like isoform X2 [Branchiostoma floridae]
MTFYISPPKGNMSLHRLHSSCCRRLTFLKEVFARGRDLSKLTELTFLCSTVERSDCLIEGSRIDQASHFTLRLACCQDTVMSEFLVEAETTLFWYRFSCMDKNQLLHLFHKIRKYEKRLQDQQGEIGKSRRDLKTEEKLRDLLKVVTGQSGNSSRWENMIQSYLHYFHSQWKHLPDMSANQDEVTQYDRRTDLTTMDCSMHCHTGCHAASRSHTASGDFKVIAQRDTCYATSEEEKIFLKVPFQYTLQLITDRRVCLHKGFAYVPSIYLPNVVANIFEECLRLGIELARKAVPVCLSDPRMREMFGTLQLQFYEDGCRGGEGVGVVFDTISRHDVDRLVDFFPPCMAHLHRTLRYKHRLKHFSRLQYTLFLKDLGLSVHDAVSFWQQEYSIPAHGGGCTHHWAKDGRRYTYNIRHLYGLEGSRVSYRSHCCQGILDRSLQPGEEGGCPFQHFDQTHLQQLLDAEGADADVRSRLVSMVMDQKPRQACQAYLFHKLQTTYFKTLAGALTYHQEQGTKDAGVEVCLECGGAGSSQQQQCDIHADCTGTLQTDSSVTTGCTTCSVRISKPLDFTRALLRLLQGLKDQS